MTMLYPVMLYYNEMVLKEIIQQLDKFESCCTTHQLLCIVHRNSKSVKWILSNLALIIKLFSCSSTKHETYSAHKC